MKTKSKVDVRRAAELNIESLINGKAADAEVRLYLVQVSDYGLPYVELYEFLGLERARQNYQE
jgi:hypothetical protein